MDSKDSGGLWRLGVRIDGKQAPTQVPVFGSCSRTWPPGGTNDLGFPRLAIWCVHLRRTSLRRKTRMASAAGMPRTAKSAAIALLVFGLWAMLGAQASLAVGPTAICRKSDGPACFGYASHPRSISFESSAGNGTWVYRALAWRGWGEPVAIAKGFRHRTHTEGQREPYLRATLVASEPMLCGERLLYTKLVVHGPQLATEIYEGCTLEQPPFAAGRRR